MNNTGIQFNSNGKFSRFDFTRPSKYEYQNNSNHDSSACIIKNGKIIYANAEERFTLKKHDGDSVRETLLNVKANLNKDLIDELIRWQSTETNCSIDHHLSHIYEVFYNSGFDDAAVFVNDGCGTANDCMTLAYMKRGEVPRIFKKFSDRYSLGNLYSIVSACAFGEKGYTGFNEGKLMGLASYGKPIDGLVFVSIMDGELVWNIEALREIGIEFSYEDMAIRPVKRPLYKYPILMRANYAATLQRDFESCSIEAIKLLHSFLKENNIKTDNLCLSGGCILNCPTNSRLIDLNLFKHYYASPNPSDGGVCLGHLYEKLIREDRENSLQYTRLSSPYLGYNYSYKEILKDLEYSDYYNDYSKNFLNLDESSLRVLCDYLVDQKILCWYQGGAEFGPRALGHRSLLADPRTLEMNQRLNTVKGRELWRPLAPVVPEELFCDVFKVANTDLCEFMLRTLEIKKEWIPMLKGVCHVDGTARPQLLKKSLNPELHNLLMLWYKRTGCPALINTSLNLAGLPIVERSSQVLDLMYASGASELVGVFVGESFSEMMIVPNKSFRNSEILEIESKK